ncbi:type VI secretion system Vgr family protein [Xenorhabdus bharatensis]|uniref:type VI secretion system Vgr family protein n=1 Tax=Xenorhabdus bharatensis TaxID=3136256 RepID=UPI0030F48676
MERYIIAHTPLGEDDLIFNSLEGEEKLSTIYSFNTVLISKKKDIDIKSLRGQSISIEITSPHNPSAKARYLNGIISDAIVCDFYNQYFYQYKFILKPKLSILQNSKGCQIWQNKTAPEIIKDVLDKHNIDFKNELTSKYQQIEYCTQYRETDFNFISRIMEQEGIYYYFQHTIEDHTLVLADSPQSHSSLSGYSDIEYYPNHFPPVHNKEKNYLYDWNVSYSIAPKVYATNDYNFLQPRAQLLETQQNPDTSVHNTKIYEWPGNYTQASQGKSYILVLQQSYTADCHHIKAKSLEAGIAPGYTFTLSNAFRKEDNGEYLIVGATYNLSEQSSSFGDDDTFKIETSFSAIPAKINWRAPRLTSWPVANIETAVVVGANDKEIWTNEYAQIKVQFHWDQEGAKDDTSSCWIRCSNTWASTRYGAIQLPRVGDEVFVSFINGNPDRPMIIGSAFNKENMPPWELPTEATKMGFMSRSIQGGNGNASYLFIDDAQDKESFSVHAEKDMDISVENDQKISIDGSRTTEIKKKQDDTVEQDANFTYKAKRNTTVEQEETSTFNNKQKTTVANGKEIEVTSGGIEYKITGDYKSDISSNKEESIKGNEESNVEGTWNKSVTKTIEVKGGSSITFSSSTIEMDGSTKIALSSALIMIG